MPNVRALVMAAALAAMTASCAGDPAAAASAGWPWGTDSVSPADFASELASSAAGSRPAIVCVAPPILYRAAHIPGAVLRGPAFLPEGLDSLKAWAQPLPRSTRIVIYCGCCPLHECPNLTPAYRALKGLGFTRVRVLLIANNFKTDWMDRGYPVER
jgi:hypothetical protein